MKLIINVPEFLSKGKKLPEGTVRTWKGKDYKKQNGKWMPISGKTREQEENEKKGIPSRPQSMTGTTQVAYESRKVSKHGKTSSGGKKESFNSQEGLADQILSKIKDLLNKAEEGYSGADEDDPFYNLTENYSEKYGVKFEGFDWKEDRKMASWQTRMENKGYYVVEDPAYDGTDSYGLIAIPPMKKSLGLLPRFYISLLSKGRKLPEGTTRDWKGNKYQKKNGEWVRVPKGSEQVIESNIAHKEVSKHGKPSTNFGDLPFKKRNALKQRLTASAYDDVSDQDKKLLDSLFADTKVSSNEEKVHVLGGFLKDRAKAKRIVEKLSGRIKVAKMSTEEKQHVKDLKALSEAKNAYAKDYIKELASLSTMIKEDNAYKDDMEDFELKIAAKHIKSGCVSWEGKGEDMRLVLTQKGKDALKEHEGRKSFIVLPSEYMEYKEAREIEALSKGKKLPEGTIREWGGQSYKKENGEWKPIRKGSAADTRYDKKKEREDVLKGRQRKGMISKKAVKVNLGSKDASTSSEKAKKKIYDNVKKKIETSDSYATQLRSDLSDAGIEGAGTARRDELIYLVYPKGYKSVSDDEVDELVNEKKKR